MCARWRQHGNASLNSSTATRICAPRVYVPRPVPNACLYNVHRPPRTRAAAHLRDTLDVRELPAEDAAAYNLQRIVLLREVQMHGLVVQAVHLCGGTRSEEGGVEWLEKRRTL